MVDWTTHCRFCGRPVKPIDSVSLGGNLYHTECCKSPHAKANADVGYITKDECEKMIAEAVDVEREACAKIAAAETGWTGEPHRSNMKFGPGIGAGIAASIRARKGGAG